MALTLKDLLEAQADLKKKDDEAAGRPASVSLDQLKQMSSSSSSPIGGAKQDASLVRIHQELKKHTSILSEMRGKAEGKKDQGATLTAEEKNEASKVQDEQTKLLRQLVENTTPKREKEEEKDTKKPDILGILGAIGTGLAIALGTVAGLISGYIKTLKFFAPVFRAAFDGFYKALVKISDFFPSFKRLLFKIEVTFELGLQMLKQGFSNFMTKAVKVFDDIIGGIRAVFGAFKESKLFQFLMTAKDAVVKYFEPIAGAFKVMQETSGPIGKVVQFVGSKITAMMEFFSMIGAKLGAFGKLFGAVSSIIGKIAFPLMVIMTIWDTVKGAIEGFEKDGIVGAIAGAIKGFVNSLVMAPLDMLKSAVSWILGAFGFDQAEKFLDSFSFTDLFSGFIDAIFSPIETLKKLFEGATKIVENIGIPEISFTVPIIDKKIAFGPYYPFKKDGASQGARVEGGSEPGKVDAGGKPAAPGGGGATPASAPGGKTASAATAEPKTEFARSRRDSTTIGGKVITGYERGYELSGKKEDVQKADAAWDRFQQASRDGDDAAADAAAKEFIQLASMIKSPEYRAKMKEISDRQNGKKPGGVKPGEAAVNATPVKTDAVKQVTPVKTDTKPTVTKQQDFRGKPVSGDSEKAKLAAKEKYQASTAQEAEANEKIKAFEAQNQFDYREAPTAAQEFLEEKGTGKFKDPKKQKEYDDLLKARQEASAGKRAAGAAYTAAEGVTKTYAFTGGAAKANDRSEGMNSDVAKIEALKKRGYTDEQLQRNDNLKSNYIDTGNGRYPLSVLGQYEKIVKKELEAPTPGKSQAAAVSPQPQPSASAPPPQAANAVYQKSEENAGTAAKPAEGGNTSVVSAPTTNVNNTTNTVNRVPSRNTDTTLQDFYKRRYAF
jgi:hypothetical protein